LKNYGLLLLTIET